MSAGSAARRALARALLVALALAALMVLVGGSHARAGVCSPCFSGDSLNGVAVAPDGRIIAVGVSGFRTSRQGLLLRRYLPDGSLDPSFARGGQATLPHAFKFLSPDTTRVAVGADGRLLVWDAFQLAAFLGDGSLDPSFGHGGVVGYPTPTAFLSGVVPLADGRIVVASQQGGVRMLEADGSPDASYGSQGFADTHQLTSVKAIALAPDGSLLVGGTTLPAGGFALVRLLEDGRIDPTFGRGGVVTLSTQPVYDVTLAVGGDGRILAGWPRYLERLLPDGTQDPGFGMRGTLSAGDAQFAPQLGVEPHGRILVLERDSLARLLPDGSRDPSFGAQGFMSALVGYPRALAVAADGSVFVAGSAWYLGAGALLAHYQPDGTPDVGFADFQAGHGELYLASLRHGYRRLTQNALINGPLAIAPDRRRIAYMSDRTGTEQLYVAAADGSHEQRLTGGNPGDPSAIVSSPLEYWRPDRIGWAPRGNRIAFTAARNRCLVSTSCDSAGTWIINADGSAPYQLSGGATFLSWSPDGTRLLLLNQVGDRVEVASTDGGPARVLAKVNAEDAVWSPRGDEIALVVINGRGYRSVELVRPNGRLIAKLGVGYQVAWAPNGRELFITGHATVSLVRADGRRLAVVRPALNPQWTSDSRLAYLNHSLHVADGRGRPLLTTTRVSLSVSPETPV